MGVPSELVQEIALQIVSHQDFLNFHCCSKRINAETLVAFGKKISAMTISPSAGQMVHILNALCNKKTAVCVKEITLLAEGLREHEYGYVWAWEDLQVWENLHFTSDDIDIINRINAEHTNARDMQSDFIYSGQYRALLFDILKACPNLKRINVRKLAPGEQIPGWGGNKLFKQLSFFRDDLDTRNIFYGDWQYDTVHGRVTQYQDEFGDVITEPNAGPQSSFMDDFRCAYRDSRCEAKVTFQPIRRR